MAAAEFSYPTWGGSGSADGVMVAQRRLLSCTPGDLTTGDGAAFSKGFQFVIDEEVLLAGQKILARWQCIRSFDSLSAPDKQWFSVAAGLMAAITLLRAAATQGSDGMSKLKTPDGYEYTFAQPSPEEQIRWAAEVAEALGNITVIQRIRVARAPNLNVFGVAGRTRSREASGRYSLASIVADLLPAGWGGDRRSYLTVQATGFN